MKKSKVHSKHKYPRMINQLDEILAVLDEDILNQAIQVSDLETYIINRIDTIYTNESEDNLFGKAKLINRIPDIYSDLEFLDNEGYINYNKNFGHVTITSKGKKMMINGGFKSEYDLENADKIVRLSRPSRLKRNERLAWISIILAIISLIISWINYYYQTKYLSLSQIHVDSNQP